MIEGNTYQHLHWEPAVHYVQFLKNSQCKFNKYLVLLPISFSPPALLPAPFGRFRVLKPDYI